MAVSILSENIKKQDLISAGQSVIVAVSGGIDSVALLHMLCQLRYSLSVRLHVASLNHGLRGLQGEQDLTFVAQLAQGWQLPFTAGHADVPQLAAQLRIGIEEAARRARYDFLARVAVEQGGDCVAVGHHALDQAETILMHIVRGSGLSGLRGMQFSSPMPYYPSVKLIRPLLNVERSDLEQYCRANGLRFCQDQSNDDTSYQRNFIRQKVLGPLLARNPSALRSFARLAEAASVDEDYLAARFDAEVLPHVAIADEAWRISRSAFDKLHAAMKRRLLREAFKCLSPDDASLSYAAISGFIPRVERAGVGNRYDLGSGIQFRLGYETLHIECKDAKPRYFAYRLIPANTDIDLLAPSRLNLCGINIELRHGDQSSAAEIALVLPTEAEIQLRTRSAGERFCPKGMNGKSRKLKDWMIDRKIPRDFRTRIPLLCADGEIVAICVKDRWHLADLSRYDVHTGKRVTVILQ